MTAKLIPYFAMIWAVFWFVKSCQKPKSDSGNDAVAFALSMLGVIVLFGWAAWAIWFIPVGTNQPAAPSPSATLQAGEV